MEGRFDMEAKVLVFAFGVFEKMGSLIFRKADGVVGHLHRFFPSCEGREGIKVFEGAVLCLAPDAFDRAANDLHEVVAKDVANEGGENESKDDPREGHSKVVQVIQKGLLGIRIGMVPDLKEFLKDEHV